MVMLVHRMPHAFYLRTKAYTSCLDGVVGIVVVLIVGAVYPDDAILDDVGHIHFCFVRLSIIIVWILWNCYMV